MRISLQCAHRLVWPSFKARFAIEPGNYKKQLLAGGRLRHKQRSLKSVSVGPDTPPIQHSRTYVQNS